MFSKIKYIFIIVLVIFICSISYIIINRNQTNTSKNENDTNIGTDYIGLNSYEDTETLIMKVIVKNGDWSKLLLTNNFKNKYNEKDGILGETQFDKVEYKPFHNGKYTFEDRNYFVITQGKRKTAYTFNLIGKNGSLDDIKYFETFNITDEYGNELDSRVGINADNFNRAFYMLSRGAEDERSIAVTDRFHRKYTYFLDLFEHYSPLEFNSIEYVSDKSSWDRKEAYFKVDSRLECKKREYIVNFTLDDRGYLDDVAVKRVSEEEYEEEPIGWDFWRNHISPILVLIYKNSNYNLIKSTDNFNKKYNNENRIFNNIYVKDYHIFDKLLCLVLDNINKYYYIDVLLLNDDKTVDDIILQELPYGNITFEDAKELYLKEYGK